MSTLVIVPVTFRQAQAFIAEHHRHHKPPRGMKFCLGVAAARADKACPDCGVPMTVEDGLWYCDQCDAYHGEADDSQLVGVATVGRPVARAYDDGLTLEVNRTCTTGEPNVNSMLYGAAWRAAKALGYRRLITYTQAGESGVSLRAAGWRVVAERAGRPSWAESSVALRHLRDPEGAGGVQRSLWEAA